MRVLDLFSGIGGFSLGFGWASPEFETVAFCEIDPYAQKVLKKHWPEVPIYDDVTKISAEDIEKVGPVECITGGFPCQDISVAGKQKGMGEGTRSGLFFEIIRIVKLCQPRYVVLENVSALLSRSEWMGAVLGSLAEIGYDADWEIIRASDMGAPHRRERIWIVAYPMRERDRSFIKPHTGPIKRNQIPRVGFRNCAERQPGEKSSKNMAWESKKIRHENVGKRWKIEPPMGRVAYGIPGALDRLKCLGNAIVPQIAELIGKQIMEVEHENPRQTD